MSVRVGGRIGPQVNTFEQISIDDHQMSVAGGRSHVSSNDNQMSVAGGRYPGPMSKGIVSTKIPCPGEG